MAVIIDIPGIGAVEAKNAASEATLKEILKAMQGVERNTKKMAGQSGGGDDGGGGDDPAAPVAVASKTLAGKLKEVGGGFARLGESIISTVGDFAKVGDSVENAAAVFSKIPLLGTLFSTVAGASVKVNDAFLKASSSGASFGGSVSKLAASASAAGMTMDNFSQLVSKNGEGMLGFGGTTEEGAKRFAQVSKSLRQTSSDLYALGYSTEDINQGLANYGDLLRKQGLQGTKSNTELAAGAQKYMKELDQLAKISGEERSAKEAQMKQLATDAQFQMAMAGKSEETRASFMKLIGGFGPTLGGFVKDFVATGTVTTEENARIAAALGGPTMDELNKLRSKLQANQQLSDEEQDRLRNIMKKASDAGSKQLGASLAASRENDAMSKAYIEGMQLQTGAVKQSAEEQRKSALEGSGFNKKMQEIQQRLAEFSNGFLIALANSGVLDFMMKTFSVLANIVQTFVVPAFNILASIISTVGGFLIDVLVPPFEAISAFIEDNLTAVIMGVGTALGLYAGLTIAANAAKIAEIGVTVAKTVAMLALIGPLAIVALGLTALASPLGIFAVVAASLVFLFKKLYDSGWSFGTAIEAIKDNLKGFMLTLQEAFLNLLDKITFGDANKAIKAKQAELALERQELADREAARDAKREQTAKERQADKDKNARDREKSKLDRKEIDDKKAIASEKEKLNYNAGAEDLAKQFAKAEGSPLIPKDKQEATAKAETTKKEIEAKGEEKTAADKKAAEERAKSEEKSKEENNKKGKGTAPATQESAESLLASLNTKMEQLIRLSAQTTTNTYEQISATKNLSGNIY